MILDGNKRGSMMEMARHLMNGDENDHVEVHEVRGFVADDVLGAMKEVDALCRGTKARQSATRLHGNAAVRSSRGTR